MLMSHPVNAQYHTTGYCQSQSMTTTSLAACFYVEHLKNAKAKCWLALPSHLMAALRKLIVKSVPY